MRLGPVQVNAAAMRSEVAGYRSPVAGYRSPVASYRSPVAVSGYWAFSSTSMNTNSKLLGLMTSCSTPVWRA